jgi:hypothetical protein
MKEPTDTVAVINAAPRTGTWKLHDDGSLTFSRPSHDWHDISTERECFFLRVYGPGDYLFKGADLGILVTKGRLQTDEQELTARCRQFIKGIRSQYVSVPAGEGDKARPTSYINTSGY